MTKKFNLKKSLVSIFFAVILCLGVFISTNLFGADVYAYATDVSITNGNFNSSGDNVTYLETSPSGWSKGINNSKVTSGAINVKDFKSSSYNLDASLNPGKIGSDNRVLMINSKSEKDETAKTQYYENSSSITLEANANYKFSTWVKVTKDAFASVYLVGLDDKYDDMLSYTNINYSKAGDWTEYTFFVATGKSSENVKLQLWLGSNSYAESLGAVFFDNISVKKLSEDEMPNDYVNLTETLDVEVTNGDFSNGFTNWVQTGNIDTSNSGAKIMSLASSNDLQSVGLGKYFNNLADVDGKTGYDFTKNNNGALVLYTTNDTKQYFGYKLQNNLELAMGDVIKVSVNVKVANLSGKAVVTLKEVANKDSVNYPVVKEASDYITLGSETISVSENSTNAHKNNYQTVVFYVKARSLQNTELSLELALGSESEKASGIVVFDSVKVEKISTKDYDNASSTDYAKKLNLFTNSSDLKIANGNFSSVEKSENKLVYPATPVSWTNTTSAEEKTRFGVINTNSTHFEANKAQYGNCSNPYNPKGFTDGENESNNVLMMQNISSAYQSVKSSSFTVSADKYYSITFDYKTISSDNALNVYILDSKGKVIFSDENITNSSLDWQSYKMLIKTYDYSSSVNVVIGFGNEKAESVGYMFVDNVILTEETGITSETYAELIKTYKTLDFMSGNFNLIQENGTSIKTALAYTGKLEKGENSEVGNAASEAGIIIGGNNDFDNVENENNTNTLKNMMIIKNNKAALYSMTANDEIELSADSYYKFSVDIKTSSNLVKIDQTNVADEDKITYGAIFGLAGIENSFSEIITSEWKTYTIYVKATETKNVNLYFALESANADTTGYVLFDNYKFEKLEASEYNLQTMNVEDKDNVLVIGSTTEDNNDDDNNNNSNTIDSATVWIAIPSIIFAVAIILALVTALMKHFKVKKWEKKKIAEYDRSKTTDRNIIRSEAEDIRNAQVKDIQKQIDAIKADIAHIEEVHKEQLRNQKGTTITREIERDFKAYAKKHTAMSNKVTDLENKIENMNTPEYLLTLQRQVAIKHIKEEKAKKEMALKKNK